MMDMEADGWRETKSFGGLEFEGRSWGEQEIQEKRRSISEGLKDLAVSGS